MINPSEIIDFKTNKKTGPSGGLPALVMSALSGLLLALAFPKFNYTFLAWIALLPLLSAIYFSTGQRQAARLGWTAGIVFFAINLAWIGTLSNYVGFWAYPGYLGLVLFQAVFILLFAYLGKILIHQTASLLSLPLLWIFLEWLRGAGPFGVSAGVVGYSQAEQLVLIQIASLTTVYGVSFLIVLANQTLFEIYKSLTDRAWFWLFAKIGFTLAVFALVLWFGQEELAKPVISPAPNFKVAIIQPNIDQATKLNPLKVNEVYEAHAALTRLTAPQLPDLIIWPESCILSYLVQNPAYYATFKELTRSVGTCFLVGTPYYHMDKTYNSIVLFTSLGEAWARYDKVNLVPFGEYLPFRPLLYPLLKGTRFFEGEFSFGGPDQKPLKLDHLKVGPAICFESTLVEPLRQQAQAGADILLTVTNDAWFKDSSAPYAHLNCGVFRAIENRKYFLQCANTGISAVIDPYGRILQRSNLNEKRVLFYTF